MTQQINDILIYDEKEYYLNQTILEKYFNKYPKKRPENNFVSTAMYRGYYAVFEIKNEQLFVRNEDYLLADLFPPNGKLEWYSGLIRIDDFRGEFNKEPENGIFEYLEFIDGNFIQKRVFNYTELQKFKQNQFNYFLLSDEIKEIYTFYNQHQEHNKPNIEGYNKIIAKRIMELTEYVYVD